MADRKAFPLRISPATYRALRRWAEDELRSVNGQIEYLLSEALKRAGRWPASGGEADLSSGSEGDSDSEGEAGEG